MAGLPPKPDDALPPRPFRGETSPRAASMRSDRDRDPHRDEWRHRSPGARHYTPPRSDTWRRRDEDRYLDHPPRSRDWDERDRPRLRGGRDRGGGKAMVTDTYVPDSHPPPRRRSPHSQIRRRPSRSRSPPSRRSSRAVPSPLHHRSPSPHSHSPSPRRRPPRSESPRRRSPSHSRKASSRERRNPRSTRSPSPRPKARRRDSRHLQKKSYSGDKLLHSKSRAASETPTEVPEFTRSPDKGSSLDVATESSVLIESPSQDDDITKVHTGSQEEKVLSTSKKFHKRPLPSGPRRPRTPTGPRARSPSHGRRDSLDDSSLRRENKRKGKEVCRDSDLIANVSRPDRSVSPPRGPRKRPRWSSQSRSESPSQSPRSPSSRSRSPHSGSPSPARSHSQQASERANSGAPRKDSSDKTDHNLPNIDDLILPLPPRESKTAAQDAELKRIREQRNKLEMEHADIMRAVRRAQHELDLAVMELRSAEERRKAAERVHERTLKGFLPPIT